MIRKLLTLTRDATEDAKRGTLILLDSLCLLIIMAWAGNGTIMRDTFLIVDSIIDFSSSSKRIKLASIIRRIWFFEVTW